MAVAETNSLYWPWYCESTGFWVDLVKELLQGMLPAIISTFFDTYLLPLAFYFISQVWRRAAAACHVCERSEGSSLAPLVQSTSCF